MHELAIATEIVNATVKAAAAHGAERVSAVAVEVGALQLVDVEALCTAFAAAAAGTLAAGARLDVREVPLQAVCRVCGTTYAPAIDDYQCPRCHAADPEFVAGNDIMLMSIDLETAEEQQGEPH